MATISSEEAKHLESFFKTFVKSKDNTAKAEKPVAKAAAPAAAPAPKGKSKAAAKAEAAAKAAELAVAAAAEAAAEADAEEAAETAAAAKTAAKAAAKTAAKAAKGAAAETASIDTLQEIEDWDKPIVLVKNFYYSRWECSVPDEDCDPDYFTRLDEIMGPGFLKLKCFQSEIPLSQAYDELKKKFQNCDRTAPFMRAVLVKRCDKSMEKVLPSKKEKLAGEYRDLCMKLGRFKL